MRRSGFDTKVFTFLCILLWNIFYANIIYGQRDQSTLHEDVLAAEKDKDSVKIKAAAAEYIGTLNLPLTDEQTRILLSYTNESLDPGFKLLLVESKKENYSQKPSRLYSHLMYIVYKENVYQLIKGNNNAPNWDSLGQILVNQYGQVGEEITLRSKAFYFRKQKSWTNFVLAFDVYFKKYSHRIAPTELNNFSWDVYENVDDKIMLRKALRWSKATITENVANNFDTYAALLYVLGHNKKAIKYEEKAVSIAPDDSKEEFAKTLEKMKKGDSLKSKSNK